MKHARAIHDDRPVHTLYLTLILILVALLVWALSVGYIAPAAAPAPATTTTTTVSSCWHPPLALDQPSESICSMRIPRG